MPHFRIFLSFAVLSSLVAAGCDGRMAGEPLPDAIAVADASEVPGACVTGSCASTELCVQLATTAPSPLVCDPVPDGGTCPAGTALMRCLGATGGMGCVPQAQSTPTHRCIAMPDACGASPTCECLPTDVCGDVPYLACGAIDGAVVECIDKQG